MSLTSETIYFGDARNRKIDASKIRVVRHADDLKACRDGELLQRWDYVSVYNHDCLPSSFTDPLRHQSDPLADDVVDYLDLKPGQDGLKAITDVLLKAENGQDVPDCIRKFWDAVNEEPPSSISGYVESEGKIRINTPHEAVKRHDRYGKGREPSLSEGQAVFWRYSAPILGALMHFTLAGGFSAPHLAATMKETNYLTSKSRDASYIRLLETTLMVLDVMMDMKIGDSLGWKSAIRVRLLHAQVRRRIKMNKGRLKVYSIEKHGIPINQYDLAIVLGGFMIAPIWSLERIGFRLTPFECASYIKAWTHIGFYLGIDSSLLERMYAQSFATAETTFAWLAFAAFPTEAESGPPEETPAYRILSAVSGRPPRGKPIGHHIELSRMSLGTELAKQLALPRGSKMNYLTSRWETHLSSFFILVGRYWPRKRWEEDRQIWFREVMYLIMMHHLGQKRSTFAWREEALHAEKLGEDEGEVSHMAFGKAVGQDIRKRWFWLLGEMIGGCVMTVGLVGGAAVLLMKNM